MTVDGVLVIDKPSGPTSHDVVAAVRRASGIGKIGHTGTLDPMATGVLPLVIGRATRLARFMTSADKAYDATIRLGVATDTFDASGRIDPGAAGASSPESTRVSVGDLEAALDSLRGSYLQTPPPFSAKKIAGIRAYRHARRGEPVVLAPVPVTVHRLVVQAFAADCVSLHIECSAGFYVRSLADTLGRRLGCGARLDALRRVRSGAYALSDATPLETILRSPELIRPRLVSMSDSLSALPALALDARGLRDVTHGRDVGPDVVVSRQSPATSDGASTSTVRLLDPSGALVALAEPAERPGFLHPVIVLI